MPRPIHDLRKAKSSGWTETTRSQFQPGVLLSLISLYSGFAPSNTLEMAKLVFHILGDDRGIVSRHTDEDGTIHDLKMGYTFLGVPEYLVTNSFGVASYWAYHKNGWDGAIQFFETKEIGTCTFAEHSLKLSKGGIRLAKEAVSYKINDKPTLIHVKGNHASGYVYNIQWYDNDFARSLECAHKKYKPSITNKVIGLAKNIDSSS